MKLQLTADCSFPSFSSSFSATHTQSPSQKTKKLITNKPYEEKQGGFFSSKKTEQNFSIIARTRMLSWLRCCAQVENYFRSEYSKHGYSLNAEEVAPFIKPGMQKSAAPSIEGPEFSLDDLKEKTDNFGSKALIGKGSCGSVYGVKLNNGKTVAVKKLDISNVEFMAQVSLVNGLKHDNLVELLCYFVEGDLRVLAYEFATMGSLHDILHGREGVQELQPVQVLDWMQRLRIAVDVVRGLEYLNEKATPSVGSRFITSKDILLFENYKAKIADYYRSNLYLLTWLLNF